MSFFSSIGSTLSKNLKEIDRSLGSFYDHNQNSISIGLQAASAVPIVGIAADAALTGIGIRNEVISQRANNATIASQNVTRTDADADAVADANANASNIIQNALATVPVPRTTAVVTPTTTAVAPSVSSLLTSDSYLFVMGFAALFVLILIVKK